MRYQFSILAFLLTPFFTLIGQLQSSTAVLEESHSLQVAYDVDVIITGGSTYAVAAAEEAAKAGASVFLLTDRPYLGEDLCMTMRYQLPPNKQSDPLLKAIWQGQSATTPLRIKKQLDLALLKHKVHFLTGSYPQELVTDDKGRFAGITMLSRSGRHFIRGKVLIDATDQGVMIRQSKVPFSGISKEPINFSFRVAGGKPEIDHGIMAYQGRRNIKVKVRKLLATVPIRPAGRKKHSLINHPKADIYEYSCEVELNQGHWAEIMALEQAFRTQCWQKGKVESSERMNYHLGITLQSQPALPILRKWPGAEKVSLAHFKYNAMSRYFILGKYAAVSPAVTDQMMQIQEMVLLGRRIGTKAGNWAKGLSGIDGRRPSHALSGSLRKNAKVRTSSRDIRSGFDAGTCKLNEAHLPILGTYDVVVVGGGTSGAPAMLGATEHKSKTLLIEYLDELGGVGTAGLIGKYWYGLRQGFTARIDRATKAGRQGWDVTEKSEWLRRTILQKGGEIWYRSYGCGAIVDGNKVVGVVVATPFGRGIVMAKTVIDSTGNSDIPIHAGAASRYSIDNKGIFSIQMAGYPTRTPGENYNNTCFALVDDSDALDVWHLMMTTRQNADEKNAFDAGQLLDSRERRRIVGDYTLTTQDILTGRTFPDTLLQMKSNFDAAAFPNSPMLLVKDMKGPVFTCDMPYRCFLPKGYDGVLATGLGASAERDAMTLVRMQPDLQNQGYAVGIAASLAAKRDGKTREVDIQQLQKLAVRQGILSAKSYGQKDSFPLPQNQIVDAVKVVADMSRELGWDKHAITISGLARREWKASRETEVPVYQSLAKLVSHPTTALPAIKRELKKTQDKQKKINLACLLAVMGDETGKPILISEVRSSPWDTGFGITSHRETHNTYTSMDRMVIALGLCSGAEARKTLISKLEQLSPESELSHLLAISLALRQKAGKDMIPSLLALLESPGYTGHAQQYKKAHQKKTKSILHRKNTSKKIDNDLNRAMKEIMVAGMLYNAGDHEGTGKKILKQYQEEVSGQLARYASFLLQEQTIASEVK